MEVLHHERRDARASSLSSFPPVASAPTPMERRIVSATLGVNSWRSEVGCAMSP